MSGNARQNNEAEPLFFSVPVNALIKWGSLDEPQRPSIDGCQYKVIAIYLDLCGAKKYGGGNEGYNIFYYPGSHNMLDDHDTNVVLPKCVMKYAFAKIG